MEGLEKHLDNCMKSKKYFFSDLCYLTIFNENEISSHEMNCVAIRYECPHCKYNFEKNKIKKHLKKCYYKQIVCERCLSIIPRKLEKNHRDLQCGFMLKIKNIIKDLNEKLIEITNSFGKKNKHENFLKNQQ